MNQQEFNFASMVRLVNFAKINSSQNKPAIRYIRVVALLCIEYILYCLCVCVCVCVCLIVILCM